MKKRIFRTQRGIPCLPECGSAESRSAMVISDYTGNSKTPIYIPTEANGLHALFPIKVGDHVTLGTMDERDEPIVSTYVVTEIGEEAELVEESAEGGEFLAAKFAALEILYTPGCKEIVYEK